ncbi:MAG: hypothetical protein ACE366_00925 [Bradymonadia bacterium]
MSRGTKILASAISCLLWCTACGTIGNLRPEQSVVDGRRQLSWPQGGVTRPYEASEVIIVQALQRVAQDLSFHREEGNFQSGYVIWGVDNFKANFVKSDTFVGIYFKATEGGRHLVKVQSEPGWTPSMVWHDYDEEFHMRFAQALDVLKKEALASAPAPVSTARLAEAATPEPATPEPAAVRPLKIAVLEMLGADALNAVEYRYLTDLLRGECVNVLGAPHMIMTRENILELLPPGVDLANCEGQCEVETGRNLGADVVLSSHLIAFGSGLRANIKAHDTQSGKLVASIIVKGNTAEEIEAGIKVESAQLLGRVRAFSASSAP